MATDSASVSVPETSDDGTAGAWPAVVFWGAVIWILAYCGVLLSAFGVQLIGAEFPCPLCMLQRYAMVLCTLGALWIVMQARRGDLTAPRYAQGLGMGIVGAVLGMVISTRQVLLHVLPGDPGYGDPILGLHLYTWALLTFVIVLLYCGVALMLVPRGIPRAPRAGSVLFTVSTAVVWLFLLVLAANVVGIILLEGFAWVLPDDPDSYNLIRQFRGS